VIGNVAANRGRALERCRMAAHAIGRIQGVIVVDVAGGAGRRRRRHVRSRQRESGHAVIKRSGIPTNSCVASRAIGRPERRTRRGVHGIVRALPGRQMAL